MRLIDADALKEAITEATYNFEQIPIRVDKVMQIIDNAQTAPLPDFKEGYKQAIIDGKTNFSKPQGKWIEKQETPTSISYYCSNCEHIGLGFENFCAWCGADMGGEEK